MKRFILGCCVFLSGFIGMIGWAVACASKVSGGVSTVLGCIRGSDWVIITIFAAMSLAGLIYAAKEARKEKRSER